MSVSTVTKAALVLADVYRDELQATITHSAPCLGLIPVVEGRGQNIKLAVDGYGSSARFYSEGADFSTFTARTHLDATLPWAEVESSKKITGLARRVAYSSMNPGEERDQMKRLLSEASEDIGELIGEKFHTGLSGQSTSEIVGLAEAIGSRTNAYMNINRSLADSDPWKPYVVDPGSDTALSIDQIRLDLNAIEKRSNKRPNIALCSYETLAKLEAAVDTKAQYWIPTNQGLLSPVANVGYDSVVVKGCRFVADRFNVAGVINYLNTAFVEFQILPLEENTDDEMVRVSSNDAPLPFGLKFMNLAKTGDSSKFTMFTDIQLVVRRPAACGVRKHVLEA